MRRLAVLHNRSSEDFGLLDSVLELSEISTNLCLKQVVKICVYPAGVLLLLVCFFLCPLSTNAS